MTRVPRDVTPGSGGLNAQQELQKFTDAVRDAAKASAGLDKELRVSAQSVSRQAAQGATVGAIGATAGFFGGGGGGAADNLRLVANVLQTAGEAASQKLEGAIGKAMGEGLAQIGQAIQGPLQALAVQQRASSSVASQLGPLAAAGVAVPDEVLQRGAAIEAARARNVADLERRAENAVRTQMLLDPMQLILGQRPGG